MSIYEIGFGPTRRCGCGNAAHWAGVKAESGPKRLTDFMCHECLKRDAPEAFKDWLAQPERGSPATQSFIRAEMSDFLAQFPLKRRS